MDRGVFICTGIIGIFLCVTLVTSLPVVTSNSWDESPNSTCVTPGCVHEASRVLKSINREAEPCDDFYEFACGGFETSTVIPDDENMVLAIFSVVRDKHRENLRSSIEKPSSPGELKTFKLAKNLYRSCMNTSAIEEKSLETLRDSLKELGGWPVIEGDDWTGGTISSVERTSSQTSWRLSYSDGHSMSLDLVAGSNTRKKRVFLSQPYEPSLPRDYLIEGMENEIVKGYLDYMVDVAVALGADEQRAARELRESLEFETKLANISWSTDERKKVDLLNKTITISELNEGDTTNSEEAGEYELYTETSLRTLMNRMLWTVVQGYMKYLTKDLREREMNFQSMLNGQKERQPRWKECLDIVSDSMPISVAALYVRNHFNDDAKEKAKEMLTDIRMAFVGMVEQARWMDEGTRTKALEKVAAMTAHIAYPEELRDDKKLEEYYADLELEPDNLLENIFNLNRWEKEEDLNGPMEPANETDWTSHGLSAVINAMYIPEENSIIVPAGLLQGGFFSNDRPRYMNYGAVGSAIGHEITHGFDTQGSQFDKEGNLVDWWDRDTEVKYLENAVCMFHQYENCTAESIGLKLNGFKTLGENIADNGGIKAAYLAYKKWMERNGHEPRLPGLDYTPEQMFWISAASPWCTKYRPEALKDQIKANVHSPGRFRVIIPFSNSPEFSADFNCPPGSAMNPVDKCSVW